MQYRLKKDLPWAKAGTLVEVDFTGSGNGNISYSFVAEWGRDKGQRVHHAWYPYMYETFSDWFEEVDERWKPIPGNMYFFLDEAIDVNAATWEGDNLDRARLRGMNVFQTEELAQRAAEQIKALLKEFHKNNP